MTKDEFLSQWWAENDELMAAHSLPAVSSEVKEMFDARRCGCADDCNEWLLVFKFDKKGE
jgi:hypothetical protein